MTTINLNMGSSLQRYIDTPSDCEVDSYDSANGLWTGRLYDNGKLIAKGTFYYDKLHGNGETYHYDGNVAKKGEFKYGKLNGNGEWFYYNNELHCKGYFVDDKLLYGTKIIYENIYIMDVDEIELSDYDLYDLHLNKIKDYTQIELPKLLNNKRTYQGQFNEDEKLHGKGKITVGDKVIIDGLFENGVFVKKIGETSETGETS